MLPAGADGASRPRDGESQLLRIERVICGVAVLALLAPAVAAGKPGHQKRKGHDRGQKVTYVFKGTVASLGAPAATEPLADPIAESSKQGRGPGHGRGGSKAGTPNSTREAENELTGQELGEENGDAVRNLASVSVRHGNRHARRYVGQLVRFDLSSAKLTVADANGDGLKDVADIAVGDTVLIQVRMRRIAALAQPFAARKLVVQRRALPGAGGEVSPG